MTLGTATEKLCKDKNDIVTCDKKNTPCFGVGYDFYPTVFSIPEPLRGDRKHTTSWIKIISNPWEILHSSVETNGGILLPLRCKIDNVNMQHNYVDMQYNLNGMIT